MVEVWRLQFGDLEIFILLYKTPKRRRFDVFFKKKKLKSIESTGSSDPTSVRFPSGPNDRT